MTAGLLVALGAQMIPAGAVTYDPNPDTENGVVRDGSLKVSLTAAEMGLQYTRTTSAGNYSVTNPLVDPADPVLGALAQACRGDDPTPGQRDLSPRATVELSDADGVIASATTPVRNYNLTGLSTVKDPQPAPHKDNYRGGDTRGAGSTFTTTFDLSDLPAGTYTVKTTTYNRVRYALGGIACTIGTPNPDKTIAAGPIVTTKTFEYRPWQHVFTDVFGNGTVSLNTLPAETQPKVNGQTGYVRFGGQKGYVLPSESSFMLPADPAACAENPASCLPSTAIECPQYQACDPRLVVVNFRDSYESVVGIFDTETKAFIAQVALNGRTRLMASLGTEQDAMYKDLLTQLAAGAESAGVDLASVLASKVRISTGKQAISLSVLNGLQMDPSTAPAGLQIVSDSHAAAGLILNIYAALAPAGACVGTTKGDSDPATPEPDRFTPATGIGYTVKTSDLLPDVPRVSPVDALGIGGPVYSIKGNFPDGAVANTTTPLIGVDTLSDEPNGYPVWIEALGLAGSPALVMGNGSNPPKPGVRTMDFLGTAMWSASESDIGVGCLVVDFMLGAGVALFNSPLDSGFGDLPLFWDANPAAAAVTDAVNDAVGQVVGGVTSNPAVQDLLDQVVGSLPIEIPLP